MMSVEGPFLSAIIARLPDPKYNLAAYGVAFALALIIEAPVIMIMSASTALVKSRNSYKKLRNFTYSMNFIATIFMLNLLIVPIFNFIIKDLISLDEKVANLTYGAVFLLLPWPGAIGYRRFFQGILINNNETRKVAYGTIIRLISMSSTALTLFFLTDLPGVYIGASSLSMGVSAEAISGRLMASKALKNVLTIESAENEILTYKEIFQFYYPLAMTSILGLGVHPLVTFLIGQGRMALESLAVLPVVNSLVFIFRAIGLSYQEVIIALAGEDKNNISNLTNLAKYAGIAVVFLLALIAYSPIAHIWFSGVSGLSPDLAVFAITPVRIMFILPGLTMLISYQRSILVHRRKTGPITTATSIEVLGIVSVIFLMITIFDATGIVAAALGYVLGRLAANLFLAIKMKQQTI